MCRLSGLKQKSSDRRRSRWNCWPVVKSCVNHSRRCDSSSHGVLLDNRRLTAKIRDRVERKAFLPRLVLVGKRVEDASDHA